MSPDLGAAGRPSPPPRTSAFRQNNRSVRSTSFTSDRKAKMRTLPRCYRCLAALTRHVNCQTFVVMAILMLALGVTAIGGFLHMPSEFS